ncbi:MAG: hypothetical protein FJ083_09815 [Cyanobacteria bacterium K_Offshore_surface_m2_239]|nr:hypothetical protein [Cyanobacteria bacterium K_Offshore_surface_m2_239]
MPSPPTCGHHRAQQRLRSLSWALMAASAAGLLALLPPSATGWSERLDIALRGAGCGFFLGLLAFHLQRVDPDDSHLRAGLVGALCAIRSLAAPLPWSLPPAGFPPLALDELTSALPSLMMETLRIWLPLWWPLIGSALLLQWAQRLLPAPRP